MGVLLAVYIILRGYDFMKMIFKLNGLDCAGCAAKIEDKVGKLDGVTAATVNFITTKLIIEGKDEKMEAIIKSAKDIIKKLEPDVVMQEASLQKA